MDVKRQQTSKYQNKEQPAASEERLEHVSFCFRIHAKNGLTPPSLNDKSFLMSFTLQSTRLKFKQVLARHLGLWLCILAPVLYFFGVQGTLSGRAWTSSSCTTLGCRHALGSRGLDETAYATSRDQIQQNVIFPSISWPIEISSPGGGWVPTCFSCVSEVV